MFLVRPKEWSALFLSVRLLQIHAANSMFVGITVSQKSVFLYQCFEVLSLAKPSLLDYKMVAFAANSKGNTGNLRCVDQDPFALCCRSFCVWFFRDNVCFRERICLQLNFHWFFSLVVIRFSALFDELWVSNAIPPWLTPLSLQHYQKRYKYGGKGRPW